MAWLVSPLCFTAWGFSLLERPLYFSTLRLTSTLRVSSLSNSVSSRPNKIAFFSADIKFWIFRIRPAPSSDLHPILCSFLQENRFWLPSLNIRRPARIYLPPEPWWHFACTWVTPYQFCHFYKNSRLPAYAARIQGLIFLDRFLARYPSSDTRDLWSAKSEFEYYLQNVWKQDQFRITFSSFRHFEILSLLVFSDPKLRIHSALIDSKIPSVTCWKNPFLFDCKVIALQRAAYESSCMVMIWFQNCQTNKKQKINDFL